MLTVIDVPITGGVGHGADSCGTADEHGGCRGNGGVGAEVRSAHRPRLGRSVLWIEADHHDVIVRSRSKASLLKSGRRERQDRSAQRAACVIGEDQHG